MKIRFAFLAISVLFASIANAAPQTFTWTNGGGDGKWSTPANWSPAGPPSSGSNLAFPASTTTTVTNDLASGSTFANVTVECGYTIAGNPFVLTGGMTNPCSGAGTPNIAANVTFSGSQTVGTWPINFNGTTTIAGTLDIHAHLTFNGPVNGSGTIIESTPSYTVTMLGGGTFSGTINVLALLMDGNLPGADVTVTYFYGRGTVGKLTVGYLWPGAGAYPNLNLGTPPVAGTLQTKDLQAVPFNLGSWDVPQFDILPSGHDEIVVTGTVALNGNLAMTLGTVSVPLTVGQTFVLIDNDGTDPVIGTFAGKPEGTLLTNSSAIFKLSYHGGDGNDVTVTVQALARTWTGAGGNNLWSNAANWSPSGAPQAGDALIFNGGSAGLDVVDDLAGGTSFSVISTTGRVHISGNSFTVSDHISAENAVTPLLTVDDDVSFLTPFQILFCTFKGHVHLNGTWNATYSRFEGPLDGSGILNLYGTPLLGGGSYFGSIYGNNTDIEIRGAFPAATVSATGIVSGGGSIGQLGWIGTLSPGSSTTGPIGRFDVGTTKDYQLTNCVFDVTATTNDVISVTGPVLIYSSGVLTVRVASGTPAPGTTYVIVANDGTDPVQGTWSGLPEGSVLNASGTQMRLSYKGGDGNDVTLTVVAPAKIWTNGSGDGRMANPANWSPATTPGAGESLSFPQQNLPATLVTNDLPAGTAFDTLSFGSLYVLSGNALTVTNRLQGASNFSTPVKLAATTLDGSFVYNGPVEIAGVVSQVGNRSVEFNGLLNGSGSLNLFSARMVGGGNFTGPVTAYTAQVAGALPNASFTTSFGFDSNNATISNVTTPRMTIVGTLNASQVTIDPNGMPSFASGLEIILNGARAGSLHAKRFVIAGPLSPYFDTASVPGTVFTILDNQGSEPIHGTFDDRIEGAQFDTSGVPMRVSYKAGDGNDCTLTVLAPVQTTLAQSAATTRLGEKFTLTANVTSTYGAPAGTVSFYDGSKVVGTSPVVNGTATLQTNAEPVGTYDFVATYTGTGIYANSTSNHLAHTVNRALPAVNVSRITVGQNDFVTVGVGKAEGVDAAPTGSLKITGEAAYNGAVSTQVVTVPVGIGPLEGGTHHVAVIYGGDANYDTLTQPFDFVVAPPAVDVFGAEVSAGDTAVVTLKLSRASRDPIAIKWSTHDGTAVSPIDYVSASDTFTFAPGSALMTVKVPTYAHSRDVRSFTVAIDHSDAPIHTGTATVRIVPVAPGASKMSLQYASRPSGALMLDLYSPSSLQARGDSPRMPLVIALQARDWSSPEDAKPIATRETERGYLVAVIRYRTSAQAPFPAQIDDIKDAVRWLRANAATYGIDTAHIGVWGFGAGGHLAALLGTTGNGADAVQAVVDWDGPTDLTLTTSPCGNLSAETAALLACGNDCVAAAAAASPATFASADDPPFLIMHGGTDCDVLPDHALRLQAALRAAGLAPLLDIEPILGGYDDPAWNNPDLLSAVDAFLDQQLRPLTKRRASH